jgi:hypothetical protein
VRTPAQVIAHGLPRKGAPDPLNWGDEMGFAQERAALAVKLPHAVKHVLQCLAFRACGTCGHARPSVPLLALDTGMSERAVRDALVELRQRPDLLAVWAYSKGGRGRTTEFIVMPALAKLSTMDCGDWGKHSNTLRHVQGLAKLSTMDCGDWGKHSNTLRHVQGLAVKELSKPCNPGSETLRRTAYHPSIHTHPSGGEPASEPAAPAPDGSGVEPRNPPGPRSDYPSDQQPPTLPQSAAEACAEAIRVLTRGSRAMPGTGRNRKPEATP